ncbi:hypothetical protein BJX76DRAFT_360528 [Aspergillus varians]
MHDFPKYAGLLKEALEDERRDAVIARDEVNDSSVEFGLSSEEHRDGEEDEDEEDTPIRNKIKRCIQYLNAQSQEMQAVGLNVAIVKLAAKVSVARNTRFHSRLGPRRSKIKSEIEEVADDYKRMLPYLLDEKMRSHEGRYRKMMSFFAASEDWFSRR